METPKPKTKCKLSRQQMEQLLKANNLPGTSFTRPKMAKILIDKGVRKYEDIYEDIAKPVKRVKKEKPEKIKDPKWARLHTLRYNSKPVKIADKDTGEVREFKSIYQASKETNIEASTFHNYNGKIYKNYMIECGA